MLGKRIMAVQVFRAKQGPGEGKSRKSFPELVLLKMAVKDDQDYLFQELQGSGRGR